MTTAQQAREEQIPAPHRPSNRCTTFARRIIGDHALVPFELVPSDVALMLIFEQNIPFHLWAAQSTTHTLAPILDADPAHRAPEGISAGIDRIGQDIVYGVVGGQSPDDATPLDVMGLDGQRNPFVTQPDVYFTSALELGEFREHELQCVLNPLIGILLDPVAPNLQVASRNTEEQRTAPRLLLQRLVRALAK